MTPTTGLHALADRDAAQSRWLQAESREGAAQALIALALEERKLERSRAALLDLLQVPTLGAELATIESRLQSIRGQRASLVHIWEEGT